MLYLGLALIGLLLIFLLQKSGAGSAVHKRFGVTESSHRLISTDLGKSSGRIKLARLGIAGIPDAVFLTHQGKEVLVGEFKSRKYRDQVRMSEFYQLMLYMGHLKSLYPEHKISGCLAYADDRVPVTFDPQVYEALLAMREEYLSARVEHRVPDQRPLHQRMRVNNLNRRLKLYA